MNRDLDFYISLPYTRMLKRDTDGDVVASIAELPGCIAHGVSEAEALEFLSEVMSAWIDERLSSNLDIPVPEGEEELPSGKWVQRVSRSLHQELVKLAKAEDVSLNQLVTTILAEAVGRRRAVGAAPVFAVPKHGQPPANAGFAFLFGHADPWQGWNDAGRWECKTVGVGHSIGDTTFMRVLMPNDRQRYLVPETTDSEHGTTK